MVKLEVGYDTQGRVSWSSRRARAARPIDYTSGDTRTITRADGVEVLQRLDAHGRLVVETVGDVSIHVIYDADGREVTPSKACPTCP